MSRAESVAQTHAERSPGESVVADSGGQAARALPVLRGQRQHVELATVLLPSNATGLEVVEPSQPAQLVQLGRLQYVFEALPAAEAPHCSQPVHPIACNVSLTEEPDVGNPQVRFCEGH